MQRKAKAAFSSPLTSSTHEASFPPSSPTPTTSASTPAGRKIAKRPYISLTPVLDYVAMVPGPDLPLMDGTPTKLIDKPAGQGKN
ncbi:transporter [Plakobranchus ocellatus]|uniref:Transporter n=1 Tax=Plakobranchus ocellatus TaxID=259542 RepID=A0AAV4DB32_9GAST|nr:transporter [Plakobranchus ocellatus]